MFTLEKNHTSHTLADMCVQTSTTTTCAGAAHLELVNLGWSSTPRGPPSLLGRRCTSAVHISNKFEFVWVVFFSPGWRPAFIQGRLSKKKVGFFGGGFTLYLQQRGEVIVV